MRNFRPSVITLACVLAITAPLVNAQFALVFGGSTAAESLMTNIAFDFLSVNAAAATVTYQQSSDLLARANIVNGTNLYDVGVAGTPFTTDDVARAASKVGTLLSFPFMATAIAVIYSMPGLPNTIPLLINKQLLNDIFSGVVTKWNDNSIQTLNSNSNRQTAGLSALPSTFQFPNAYINYMSRYDASSTVNAFLRALNSASSSFPIPPSDKPTWPWLANTTMTGLCPGTIINPIPSVGSAALTAMAAYPQYACPIAYDWPPAQHVLIRPYSIAFVASQHITGLPYFVYQHPVSQKAIYPTNAAVQSAVTEASTQPSTYGKTLNPASTVVSDDHWASDSSVVGDLGNIHFRNGANNDAWPINEVYWFLLPKIVSSDCGRALEILQFMIWTIQSTTSTGAMTYLGFSPLPINLQTSINEAITQVQCGSIGSTQAAYDSLYTDQTALRIVADIIAGVMCLAGLFLIWKREHPVVMKSGGVYVLAFTAFGAAGNVMTTYMYTGFNTDSSCRARPWVYALALVTIYGCFMIRLKHFLRIKDESTIFDDHNAAEEEEQAEKAAAAAGGNIEMVGTTAKPAIASVSSTASHDSSGFGGWISSLSQSERRMVQFAIGLGVVLLWAIIPLVWVLVEPPQMSQRKCVSPLYVTFQLIDLGFNICMIIATSVMAALNNELDSVVHPVFIMLLTLCMFEPMVFVVNAAQFPLRSQVALVLQPSVGILLGTSLEVLLILGPAVQQAYSLTPDEYLARITLERDVERFRTQRTKRMSKSLEQKAN